MQLVQLKMITGANKANNFDVMSGLWFKTSYDKEYIAISEHLQLDV